MSDRRDIDRQPLCLCFWADQRSIHVYRMLDYLTEAGHQVHLLSFYRAPVPPGVRLHVVASRFARFTDMAFLVALPRIKRLLKDLRPDILHAVFVTNYGFYAAATGFHPAVVSAIGSDILVHPYRSRRFRLMTELALAWLDGVVTDTPRIAEIVRDEYHFRGSVQLAPLGVDLRQFTRVNDSGRREGPSTLLSFRSLERNYNVDTIIEAFALVAQRLPASRLIVAGGGSQQKTLTRLASERGVAEHVSFLGPVDHHDLPAILDRAFVFVSVPSSDGTSVSLLESMAMGLLPIVSDLPANREWVRDGVNGLMVPAGDAVRLAEAMVRALTDQDLQRRAALEGPALVAQRADFRKNMEEIVSFYRELVAGRTGVKEG